jgi:hypothetical protein
MLRGTKLNRSGLEQEPMAGLNGDGVELHYHHRRHHHHHHHPSSSWILGL